MVEGGMSVVKFLLFAFNFVFVICGIALISVGALAYSSGREYTVFLESKFLTAPTILIILGCIIFFIAFLGCCGALRQNHCMIMTFSILLVLIFVVEISAGILAYVYRGQVDGFLQKNMKEAMDNPKSDAMKVFDEMQTKWQCCGSNSSADYDQAKIPKSCCPQPFAGDYCPAAQAFTRGCYKDLKDKIMGKITTVGGIGIGIAFIEILGIVFGCCLASAIKKGYDGV